LPDPWRLPVIVVPAEIATIGDMPNDILMFADTALSIAMGNADFQVKRAARHVTDTNDNNGFAWGMECLVLADAPAQDG
jgi:hydroxymethylpyrimidine pyrophosphatase-like HAD family hydrolase